MTEPRTTTYRGGYIAAVLAAIAFMSACANLDNVRRELVDPDAFVDSTEALPAATGSPIKAHMPDGGLYVFRQWSVNRSTRILGGDGSYYGVNREVLQSGHLTVPVDSIALIETNVRSTSASQVYLGLLTGATAALGVYCVTTPKACFGSCPTIYANGLLEAESFSHSIVPLFEMRDVDRLSARPDAAGKLTLEVRNEALETHYINHLELLEVAHPRGTYAVPSEGSGALVLDDFRRPAGWTDGAGRAVDSVLASVDGRAFESSAAVLREASLDDPFDYIELAVPWSGGDTAAVLVTMRASLLSTVLFYDYMLKGRGLDAIDWLTRELDTIEGAVEIGQFYRRWMGVRVSVFEGDGYREVGRLGGAGPIAWDDAAMPFDVPPGTDTLRVRLSFLADAFRFDRVAVAASVERVPARVMPVADVRSRSFPEDVVLAEIAKPDETYAVTHPGTRFEVEFDAGASGGRVDGAPRGRRDGDRRPDARTYFLAAQGYYIEWLRKGWLQDEAGPRLEGDAMIPAALARWADVKEEYEELFFETRIPVR